MKYMLLVSACTAGLSLFVASPAAAQQACDLNGVVQPPPTGTDDLTCGTVAADFGGNNSTLVGTDLVVFGEGVTAVGSNVWVNSQESSFFSGPYDPPSSLDGGTSVGSYSFAMGSGAVAVGDRAGVGVLTQEGGSAGISTVLDGTAIGSGARVTVDSGVALGANTSVTAANSVALGTSSIADQPNTVSVGTAGGERRIVNVAAGINGTDAVNVGQMQAADAALQAQINAGGAAIPALQNEVAALDNRVDDLDDRVDDVETRVDTVETRVDNVETVNANQQSQINSNAANIVAIEAVNANQQAQIENNATDIAAVEVVNATQQTQIAANTTAVVAVNTRVDDVETVNATQSTQITAVQAVNTTQSTQISTLNSQVAAMNGSISDLQLDVGTLFDLQTQDRREMRQGVASAMAMSQAPMPSQPGRVSYAVNGARFRGEHAVGGSMMYRLNTASPMAVGVGLSYSGKKNNGARVGIAGEF